MTAISPGITEWLAELLHERISDRLHLRFAPGTGWEISTETSPARLVITADAADYSALTRALPPGVATWDPRPEGLIAPLQLPLMAPGATAVRNPLVRSLPDGLEIGFDLLWLALWAMSRAEEVAVSTRDEHGRFPAQSAHAYAHGYLHRPIVDEWFAVLRELTGRVWPGLKQCEPAYALALSHDIDEPTFLRDVGLLPMLRRAGGDVVRRRRVRRGCEAPFRWMALRAGLFSADPFDTFGWLMSRAEEHHTRSVFHFLCGRTDPRYDRRYDITDPFLQTRLQEIQARGHTIGLHPSYGTASDPRALSAEADKLRQVCGRLGIGLVALPSRMHFLRWSTPWTAQALAQAGVTSDCTLGYAEQVGFRCGTCHSYSAFDPVTLQPITLRIDPLIAMDVTFLQGAHLDLSPAAALALMTDIKNKCRVVNGRFTLCWHNSELDSAEKRELFESILDA